MKILPLLLSVTLALASILSGIAADGSGGKRPDNLRHVVAFKFKTSTSPEQIRQVENAFRDLKKRIPQIAGYEWGTNNSPENRNRGCTHSFILTFRSEKDRDAYLVHPEHKEFGKLVGPLLDDVFVIDFWAQD
ncbi:MAG: Dabb family protein [Chloroflexi bacterium]|nr:Dabb family protein [Chloroflexota bacterium]